MGRVTRRDRGALEKEVVAVLAAAGRPLTPSEVQAELGGVLAYTTVMTSLVRLADKGVLQRDRTGRAYAYRLIGDATVITARRMRQLLESGSDRAGVLASFVAELRPEEGQLLAELLQQAAEPPSRE
jgi:predicted transcriptional regulator